MTRTNFNSFARGKVSSKICRQTWPDHLIWNKLNCRLGTYQFSVCCCITGCDLVFFISRQTKQNKLVNHIRLNFLFLKVVLNLRWSTNGEVCDSSNLLGVCFFFFLFLWGCGMSFVFKGTWEF